MKVKPLLSKIQANTFLEDYLRASGVDDPNEYINAGFKDCDNPWDYPNMREAVERLHEAIESGKKIGVLADSDCDGQCSATITYRFIKALNPNQAMTYFMHVGKQHGLVQSRDEDIIRQVVEAGVKLLIVPDAGSNDTEQCEALMDFGTNTLILDHHEIEKDNLYAIVVNHHLGEGLNINLSGSGVTYKFIKAYAEKYGYNIGDSYLDLVATSLVTDMCDMTSVENYVYAKYGLTHVTNPMLKAMFKAFNRGSDTPRDISWGTGPKINAVCRGGTMEDKRIIFDAFIGEGDIDEAIAVAKRVHKEQSVTSKKMAKQVEDTIDMTHKVLVGFSDAEYKNYSGLIANKLTGSYGKPTLVLRENNPTTWSGSLRSPVDIADKINGTGLARCQGHLSAAGIFVKKSNLEKLINWFDKQDIEPVKNVAGIIDPNHITSELCAIFQNNMLMWGGSEGAKLVQPKFYVSFETIPSDVTVFIKRTKTVKFNFKNGMSILKFLVKQDDVDMLTTQRCRVEAVVTLENNEWNGSVLPQGKVEEWEISPIEDKVTSENDWEDWF